MHNTTTTRRWVLFREAHAAIVAFGRDWKRLAPASRKAWFSTIVVGWLVSAGIMLASVVVVRGAIDDETALFERALALVPFDFAAAIWIETPGNSIFLIPVVLIAAALVARSGRPLLAISILTAFFAVDTLILLGWLTWDRPRPTLVLDGIAAPGFHSFPSGHVAQTVTVYGLLAYVWVSASRSRLEQTVVVLLAVLLVVAVGMARLALGTHWPSDLLAGAIIGLAWLATIVVALRRAGEQSNRLEG
jgi:membrane-associated phospholipid phosphatase